MQNSTLQNSNQTSTLECRWAYGMGIKSRAFEGFRKFRYQFNGKEFDSETSTQDYGMRIYDGRLGRFLSIDPLYKTFPWYTPYQFAGNKPIWAIDLDGAEEIIQNKYTWNGIPWLTITTSVLVEDRAEGHKQTVDGNLEYVTFTHENYSRKIMIAKFSTKLVFPLS